ncbi:MAG: DUF72 domain-containing protein [Blastocatellia bacterium]|nr:DUF72 domain-containing protein [Blastocatellia bacterium]MCS7156531.1 DUF72 domain-containing protein [Blastocatellia bacterium]MCX7751728.1 DUF72 domain-containing protein [Blastocatellia bacterium]MDW8168829.1 DUF72 domain-containing protein [Acidobacteriota bacterium]MDW8257457.1 DUF72 domain-containing protein [Acidobacteriota bacterium]
MSRLAIGTSGWNYAHWKSRFYPETLPTARWLEFYSRHFRTVEVNATFYRTPRPTTVRKWIEATPDDFVFSVKMNRRITHRRRLSDAEEALETFLAMLSEFGEKLGTVLIQLPPSVRFDREGVERFFKTLRHKSPRIRYALEPRHRTWLQEEAYALLRYYEIAFCQADSGGRYPTAEVVTAPFVYLRFHGPGALYASAYTDEQLRAVAEKICAWRDRDLDVYAYFNNDFDGYAIENARKLIEFVNLGKEDDSARESGPRCVGVG